MPFLCCSVDWMLSHFETCVTACVLPLPGVLYGQSSTEHHDQFRTAERLWWGHLSSKNVWQEEKESSDYLFTELSTLSISDFYDLEWTKVFTFLSRILVGLGHGGSGGYGGGRRIREWRTRPTGRSYSFPALCLNPPFFLPLPFCVSCCSCSS